MCTAVYTLCVHTHGTRDVASPYCVLELQHIARFFLHYLVQHQCSKLQISILELKLDILKLNSIFHNSESPDLDFGILVAVTTVLVLESGYVLYVSPLYRVIVKLYIPYFTVLIRPFVALSYCSTKSRGALFELICSDQR